MQTLAPPIILAHIGRLGEVHGKDGSIVSTNVHGNIQGFSLSYTTSPMAPIEYRARRSDGSWTDWVKAGQFVGTRGKSSDLTGLALRIPTAADTAVKLLILGAFRRSKDLVRCGSGEECTLTTGLAPLYGMQIILVGHNP